METKNIFNTRFYKYFIIILFNNFSVPIFRCPGSFHDARVWKFSHAKFSLERRFPRYLLAGDQGYPKSPLLVIPYPDEEAEQDPSKRLFNIRFLGNKSIFTLKL